MFSQREGCMCGFVFVNFEAPFVKPLFRRVGTSLESGGTSQNEMKTKNEKDCDAL